MITWKVINGSAVTKRDGWHFSSFLMQEYLLPLINVGFAYIDEYGDTTFQRDDCFRMKGNISYLLDSSGFFQKAQIRYDSLEKGLVTLDCADIRACLTQLRNALDQALVTNSVIVFYGD